MLDDGIWVSWNNNIKHPHNEIFFPKTEDEEQLNSYRLSIGLLGITSTVIIQCVELYTRSNPRWTVFIALRRKLDPEGRFLNSYLEKIYL